MHISSSSPPAALDTLALRLPTSDLPAMSQPSARPESLIPRHSAYDFSDDDEEVTARFIDDGEDFSDFAADDLEDES